MQDGSSIWGKRSIDGPGVWVSCVKGKEKQTVGELYDLFEQVRGLMCVSKDNSPEVARQHQSSLRNSTQSSTPEALHRRMKMMMQ